MQPSTYHQRHPRYKSVEKETPLEFDEVVYFPCIIMVLSSTQFVAS